MAVTARDTLPTNDVTRMSQNSAIITDNLFSIETELRALGDKLFGNNGGDCTESVEGSDSVMGTMQDNLERAARINEMITIINRMI